MSTGTKQVVVQVQDIGDRYITINVDENFSEADVKAHVENNFFCRGMDIVSDEDGETTTHIYNFTMSGVDEDGYEHEPIYFHDEDA
jgi:hypothetical protein